MLRARAILLSGVCSGRLRIEIRSPKTPSSMGSLEFRALGSWDFGVYFLGFRP